MKDLTLRGAYGIVDIYTMYRNNIESNIKDNIKEITDIEEKVVDLDMQIGTINKVLGLRKENYDSERNNMNAVRKAKIEESKLTYISLLRGRFNTKRKLNDRYHVLRRQSRYLTRELLTPNIFKTILRSYNHHMLNMVIEGYKEFYLSENVGKLVIEMFDVGDKKIHWGKSIAYKKELESRGLTVTKYDNIDKDGKKYTTQGKDWIIYDTGIRPLFKLRKPSNKYPRLHKIKPAIHRTEIKHGDKSLEEICKTTDLDTIYAMRLGIVERRTAAIYKDKTYHDRYGDDSTYEYKVRKIDKVIHL